MVGVAINLLPFVPAIDIATDWILGNPSALVYSSAVNLPTMDFRHDLRTISGLSVVLVVASVVSGL